MRLVHHHEDATSTADRLMGGDDLHFEALKGCRNVVLSTVIGGGGFLVKLLGT